MKKKERKRVKERGLKGGWKEGGESKGGGGMFCIHCWQVRREWCGVYSYPFPSPPLVLCAPLSEWGVCEGKGGERGGRERERGGKDGRGRGGVGERRGKDGRGRGGGGAKKSTPEKDASFGVCTHPNSFSCKVYMLRM